MTDDLVKRLRDGGETCGIDACKVRDAKSGCLCAIAADRIETLEAALLEEKDSAARYDCVVDVLSGRIKTLEAALREIAAPSKIMAKGEDMETALKVMLSSHRNTAIAALAGEKKE